MKKHSGKKRAFCFFSNVFIGLIAAALCVVWQPKNADAYRFEAGGFNIDFNSVFSLGVSYRVEGRDWDMIGKANQREFYDDGKDFADPMTFDGDYKFLQIRGQGVTPPGRWSSSTDDGNLNFDTGVFSEVIKGTHDFDINKEGYGIFARATWFYDYFLMSESEDMRIDIMENDDIKENHGQSFDILDYFAYGSFDIGNIPVSLRVGSQRVNWGEATFMSHGISVSNPIDAAKARVPGAESLKEAFVPQGAVWASVGLTDSIGIEGYYQYEWEATDADSPGTYFATSDVAGPGSEYTQFGFAQFPDYIGPQGSSLNYAGNAYEDLFPYGNPTQTIDRLDDEDADDSGQFGIKLDWYAEFLNNTEFSFYYSNYHRRSPIPNFIAADPTIGGTKIKFVYPEDIKLMGLSFNTLLPFGISCGGEIAHRIDEPYAIDGVEMAFAAAVAPNNKDVIDGSPLTKETLRQGYPQLDLSQVPGVYLPGEEIQGYIELDSTNYDFVFLKSINRFIGAQVTLLAEFGATQIHDMPDQGKNSLNAESYDNPKYLRLETPGTDRSGNTRRTVPTAGNTIFNEISLTPVEGVEENDFADDFSWGYVALAKFAYTDVFMNVNVAPIIRFKHDVSGTAPSSAGTFIEGRQELGLSLTFDYQAKWFWTLGYTMFMGGEDTTNELVDRDYVSFDLKYAI